MILQSDLDDLYVRVRGKQPFTIFGVDYVPAKPTNRMYRPTRESEPMWVCLICGAVVVEDAWPLHDSSHK